MFYLSHVSLSRLKYSTKNNAITFSNFSRWSVLAACIHYSLVRKNNLSDLFGSAVYSCHLCIGFTSEKLFNFQRTKEAYLFVGLNLIFMVSQKVRHSCIAFYEDLVQVKTRSRNPPVFFTLHDSDKDTSTQLTSRVSIFPQFYWTELSDSFAENHTAFWKRIPLTPLQAIRHHEPV